MEAAAIWCEAGQVSAVINGKRDVGLVTWMIPARPNPAKFCMAAIERRAPES